MPSGGSRLGSVIPRVDASVIGVLILLRGAVHVQRVVAGCTSNVPAVDVEPLLTASSTRTALDAAAPLDFNLDAIEVLTADDRLVVVFHNEPFALRALPQ